MTNRKRSQRHKPFTSFNTQAPPKKKTQNSGPSQKSFSTKANLHIPKTYEEALQMAFNMLIWDELAGKHLDAHFRGLIVGFFTAPFSKE